MWVSPRVALRIVAGALAAVLALPFVLSTPWAKAAVFTRIVAWARTGGIDLRASRFDYHVRSLTIVADNLSVAAAATPERPMARMEHVELELGASVLRGLVAIDAIRVRNAHLVFDRSTRPQPAPAPPAAASDPAVPAWPIGAIEVDGLELEAAFGEGDGTRILIHQMAVRAAGPALEGDINTGAGEIRFGAASERVTFDRLAAHVTLDQGHHLIAGELTAWTPIGELRAEGHVPIDPGGDAQIDAEGSVTLEALRAWWPDAPDWQGPALVAATVSGPLRSPAVSYRVSGNDLRWAALTDIALDMSGQILGDRITVQQSTLASRRARLDVNGEVAFGPRRLTHLHAQVHNVGIDLAADLLSAPLDASSRATVDGTTTISWPGATPRLGTVAGEATVSIRGIAPDESANGTFEVVTGNGQWRLRSRYALAGQTSGSFDGVLAVDDTRPGESPFSGPLTLHAADLGPALAQLRRLGVTALPPLPSLSSEHVEFDGTLGGTLASPRVDGTLAADGVAVGPLARVAIAGTLAADINALTMTPLQLDHGASRVRLSGTLPWRAESGQGTLTGHIEDLASFDFGLPPLWAPSGIVNLDGAWTGSAADLGLSGRVSGTSLAVNGVAFTAFDARVSHRRGEVAVEDLRAVQPDGSLRGSLTWSIEDRTVSAALSATNLVAGVLIPGDDGTMRERALLAGVSLDTRVEGTIGQLLTTATVEVGSALVDGRPVGPLTGRLEASGGPAQLAIAAPGLHATLDARVTPGGSWPFDGMLSLNAADVAALARAAGADPKALDAVDARIDVEVRAEGEGTNPAATHAEVVITKLDGRIQGLPATMAEAGRIVVESQALRVIDPVQITVGAAALSLTPASADSPEPRAILTLTTPLSTLVPFVSDDRLKGVSADGLLSAELALDGRLDALSLAGHVQATVATLTWDGRELARDARIEADLTPARVVVRTIEGTIAGSAVQGSGDAPVAWLAGETSGAPAVEPARFSLTSGVAVAPLLAVLGNETSALSGTVNLSVEGTATAPRLDAIQATIRDNGGALRAGAVAIDAQRRNALRLDDGRLIVEAFEWRGGESSFSATGALALTEGRDGVVTVNGTASLALAALVVPARLDGLAHFDVAMSGPPGARDVAGTIDIAEGMMVVPALRLSLVDWAGSISIANAMVHIEGLHGQLNGGQATLEGRVPLRGPAAATPGSSTLALSVRSAFLDVPQGLRSQVDADLSWTHEAQQARLSGSATVTASTYREPVTQMARTVSRLMDQRPRSVLPSRLAETSLDIRLSANGPLAVSNSVARVEMAPTLRLTGTVGQPGLDGQIAVANDGRIQFAGRQYRLRESRIQFAPDQGLVPRLAISGETRVSDYTVYLRMTGAANEFETSLTSDPPLGERDLQRLLVTGQASTTSRGRSDQEAVGAVGGDVLGLAGQFLGVDSVTVSTTDDLALITSDVDPALRLTVSKRLGRRFEIVLSDNLDDDELTWVVIYRPRPGFELRAISRDNTEYTGEFRQEILFGPGVSAPPTVSRAQVVRERVARVTVSGQPGFPAAEVLASTGLRGGARFDFRLWLDDRDRIAAFYSERGYLSARVVPTRHNLDPIGDDAQVALDYRVTRGPETILSVVGYDAPPDLLTELKRAWSGGGLVELLDEDLTEVMRTHLVSRGYLRATTSVGVNRAGVSRITATITVDPGIRTTEREVVFAGNHVIDGSTLLSGLEALDLGERAWIDPALMLEWIQDAYATHGYLTARAAVGAIVFEGSRATLPVHIIEGAQAHIATLTVSGVQPQAQAAAVAATGVAVGQPYVPGSEPLARAALAKHYRDLGYRDVIVESAADVDAATGRVGLTFAVEEGPRYVVRSVQTTGVQSTRASLVERATQIVPGGPASPSSVETTRRQLYDIGTFRSAEVTFVPTGDAAASDTVPVDAVVSVQESKRFLLLYGLEVSNQYQSVFDQRVTSGGVALDLRDRNFLGRGWTLGAGLRYQPNFQSGRLLATIPRFMDTAIRTNVYLNSQQEDRGVTDAVIFRDQEMTFTLEQRWRPWGPLELAWGYSLDDRTLSFLETESKAELLAFDGILAGPTGAVIFDRRDNLFDAKRGWMASTTAEWGMQPLGSVLTYLRVVGRGSYYQPLGPLTLAASGSVGSLQAFSGEVPLTVLDVFFTAGGTQSVRGYRQDSLSAYTFQVGDEQVPIGGTQLVVLNGEVRAPLFWRVSAVGFVDAGNTFIGDRKMSLGDLAVGAGIGVRISTPLAPIRLDLGFPMSRWTGQRGARWHFSFGQMF